MHVLMDTNVMISGTFWPGKSKVLRVSVCRDDDDNRVLECALDGRADYIVTGDKDLLDLKVFEGIKVVNVSDFLQLHQRSE
ncbi:MAG: putative toxin-antitoxin system toxin component, PIN family [Candidatus Fraserbacteria bacterium RBG_16_55_9]|uniref:Putative toxin-antitoxin system toxin component, PIN family n=1 Tax=Fraserbacteria sp. (strain RBG_16_55_9) TaxID=1817864 RepID=A0A1F5UNE1_FRAXR|nr:MAG: putative toxin-antitoxin system toxin component, PIN family [Candidatus Fraserbacteria bacterium RBG_16_55_9]